MSDSVGNWNGGGGIAYPWAVQTLSPEEQQKTAALIKDTLATAGLTGNIVDGKLYVALISKPQLDAPTGGLGGANVGGKSVGLGDLNFTGMGPDAIADKMTELIDGMVGNIKSEMPPAENPVAAAIDAAINSLSDAKLEKLDPSRTPEQVKALLFFAVSHPEVVVSEEIRAAAASILDAAETETGQTFDSSTMAVLDGILGAMQNGSFIVALQALGLSPELNKLLTLAASIPALAAALPPDLQELLARVQAVVEQQIGVPFGVPSGWQLTNSADVELMAGARFDQDVMGKLQGMLDEGAISQDQFNELRSAYYLGQEGTSPVLQKIIEGLQASQLMPAGYRLPIDAESYQALLNGATFAAFKQNIVSVEPPLSNEQQAMLLMSLTSPAAFQSLPPELKAVFMESKSMAVGQTAATYHLPDSWEPDVQALAIAISNIGSPELALRQSAINLLTEMLSIAKALIGEINTKTGGAITSPAPPTGAQPTSIASYMDAVSEALLGLQDQLHAASAASGQVIRRLNLVNKDTMTTKLEKQQKELADVKAAHTKQQVQGLVGQYGMMVGLVVMMIFCPYLIPVAIAMMIAMMAMMIAGAAKGMKLDDTHGPLDLMAKGADLPVKMIWVMLTVMFPIAMAVMGLVDLMFTGGKGLIEPALKAYGVPETVISKVLMALQLASILAMILLMIAFAVIPGLQPLAAAMAEAMGQMFGAVAAGVAAVASGVGKTVKAVVEVAIAAVRILGEALETLGSAVKDLGKIGKFFGTGLENAGGSLGKLAEELSTLLAAGIREGKNLGVIAKEIAQRLSLKVEQFEVWIGKGMDKVGSGLTAGLQGTLKGVMGAGNYTKMADGLERLGATIEKAWSDLLKIVNLDKSPAQREMVAKLDGLKGEVAAQQAFLPKGYTSPEQLKAIAGNRIAAEEAVANLKAMPMPRSQAVQAQLEAAEQTLAKADEALTEAVKRLVAKNPNMAWFENQTLEAQQAVARLKARPIPLSVEDEAQLVQAEVALKNAQSAELNVADLAASGAWNKAELPLAKLEESQLADVERLAMTELKVSETEAALLKLESEQSLAASAFVEQMQLFWQGAAGVVQAGWGAYNKVLEGQIALIKGAFEAYAVETEAFLKILTAVINNAMAQLQDLGDTVKRLVDMQSNMTKGMSECMTRLSAA